MSGISEVQSRIQSIQNRVAQPPIAGRFSAMFEMQLAAARTDSAGATTGAAGETEYVVGPSALESSTPLGSTPVTLGMMLGVSSGAIFAPRSTTTVRSEQLEQYLAARNIEGRNGRLATTELTAVTGGWNGSAYLLPPAATAWEEMRAAAGADGVDLRAIDTYRSWEVQDAAHQAHLRGEKKANVLPAGQSEHGNGLAVDVTNGHLVGVGDAEYTWLRTNGARYGWYPISTNPGIGNSEGHRLAARAFPHPDVSAAIEPHNVPFGPKSQRTSAARAALSCTTRSRTSRSIDRCVVASSKVSTSKGGSS